MTFNKGKRLILFSVLFLLALACRKEEHIREDIQISMTTSATGCEASDETVSFKASAPWMITLQYNTDQLDWATLNITSGVAGSGDLRLSIEENKSGKARELKLVGTCGKRISVWTLRQSALPAPSCPADIKESKVGNWMEMPSTGSDDGLLFFSHRHQVKGQETRDWSFYWDIENRLARWVAYPLNKKLIAGSGIRTNAWQYDPILPQRYQPDLHFSYRGRWQRGHQMPSADRQIKEENERTFYYTNMTPQDGELNENVWAALESRVRTWSYQFDTLYVVTGCTLKGSPGKATDRSGKQATIPGGYFKALLGYSRTGGYTSIGFYFDNKPAYDVMSHAMTVAELEKKTGLDFFVNLPSQLGENITRRIKNTKDDLWKNN